MRDKEKHIVITPGGPRPASTIHTVRATDTVRIDETGLTVDIGKAKSMTDPELVVTPGGPRNGSLIHKVESGYTVRVESGRLENNGFDRCARENHRSAAG